MAIAFHIPGPCLIKVDTGSSNALETLGYTADGARGETQFLRHETPVDALGGQGGIPGEIQYLGFIDTVTLDLTKFDSAVFEKLLSGLYGATVGAQTTAISSVEQSNVGVPLSSNSFRLLLLPSVQGSTVTNHVRNYKIAIMQSAGCVTGTKAKRQNIVFRCYPNSSGVTWDRSVS